MMLDMRTTVTLDPDSDAIVRRLMRERGLSFKGAVNAAIRAGAAAPARRRPFRTHTYDMGLPAVPVDKALRFAAELEDEALIRKLAERK
jgi:hypothetical protein